MNIADLLENKKKEIAIILDNYRPHHNTEFKMFCEMSVLET